MTSRESWYKAVVALITFLFYGCFGNKFVLSLGSHMTRFWKKWEARFTDKEERRNYLAAEWRKVLFVVVWVCINVALFIEAAYRWYFKARSVIELHTNDPSWNGYTAVWLMLAKAFGQLLNFNCCVILLPPMRTLLNILRTLKIDSFVPIDKNIIFHRYLAYWICVCTSLHALAHYMNYSCCYRFYTLNNSNNHETSTWTAMWANKYGLTGALLCAIMIIMYGASAERYRRSNNFTVFWYCHHLFILFFCILLIHGINFWMWFFGPLCVYIIERMLRNVKGEAETIVKRVHILSANVLLLELEKPNFIYYAGQYCFLNCPIISKYEWHPFTISSAPEEENLTFHIRIVGDWTSALKELFIPHGKGSVEINKPTTPDGENYLVRVDGPFGTSAESVYNYEFVMLVAAGIGVTPYASLLKHFKYMLHARKNFRIKKCFFYWINRDRGSWEWFADLIDELERENPDFFQIHTFMTGDLTINEIRQIIAASPEIANSNTITSYKTEALMAKTIYNYEPQDRDEIHIEIGDSIEVLERDESNWWKGKNLTSDEIGLFPSNCVALIDTITKTRESKNRKFGRPNWHLEFSAVRTFVNSLQASKESSNNRPTLGVFLCGPPALSKQLYQTSIAESLNSNVLFKFHKENF